MPPFVAGQRRNAPIAGVEVAGRIKKERAEGSTLARLEALLRLVDDVNAAFAAHESVVAMARAERLEGITDLHGITQQQKRGQNPRRTISGARMPHPAAGIKRLAKRPAPSAVPESRKAQSGDLRRERNRGLSRIRSLSCIRGLSCIKAA